MSRKAIVVIDDAVPKGRPRATLIKGKIVTYTPKRTREAEKVVALIARAAWEGEPSKKRFVVDMVFKCRNKRTDGDNLEKLVLDAVEGIIFENDSQVETVVRTKTVDTKNPSTSAVFIELEDGERAEVSLKVVGGGRE